MMVVGLDLFERFPLMMVSDWLCRDLSALEPLEAKVRLAALKGAGGLEALLALRSGMKLNVGSMPDLVRPFLMSCSRLKTIAVSLFSVAPGSSCLAWA